MTSFFYFMIFLCENEPFQRGWGVGGGGEWGVLWKITKGLGGHQPPTKMENPGRWQGPKWNSLNSVGLDTEPLDVEFVDECSVQRK